MNIKKLIPLILFITACTTRPEGFVKYTGNGFSLYYPSDWSASQGDGDIAAVFTAPVPAEMIEKTNPTVRVAYRENEKGSSLMEKSIELLSQNMPQYKELSRVTPALPFSSYRGTLTFSSKLAEKQTIWQFAFFEKENTDIIVWAICDDVDFKTYEPTFGKIIKTFSFTGKGN